MRVEGRVMPVPERGMVLPDCARAVFESPSVRVRYLLYADTSSLVFYDSEEVDRGKPFGERLQPRVSPRELLRRQLKPAAKYAGFVAVQNGSQGSEVLVATTGALARQPAPPALVAGATPVEASRGASRQLCLDEAWREMDCSTGGDKIRLRVSGFQTRVPLQASDTPADFVAESGRAGSVRLASVPGYEGTGFLHALRSVVKAKDEPVQPSLSPSDRLDQLLAELMLATLTADAEMAGRVRKQIEKEFPQLFRQLSSDDDLVAVL